MAAEPKSMAERHRDEITAIISGCEQSVAPHKHLAFYRPGDPKVKPPVGWSRKTASDAMRTVSRARAKCSADIRSACERQRAEANAKPVAALAASVAEADARPAAASAQ